MIKLVIITYVYPPPPNFFSFWEKKTCMCIFCISQHLIPSLIWSWSPFDQSSSHYYPIWSVYTWNNEVLQIKGARNLLCFGFFFSLSPRAFILVFLLFFFGLECEDWRVCVNWVFCKETTLYECMAWHFGVCNLIDVSKWIYNKHRRMTTKWEKRPELSSPLFALLDSSICLFVLCIVFVCIVGYMHAWIMDNLCS